MKTRFLVILMFLLSFTLLTACTSEEDADKLVKEYVSEKYGFDVEIIERENVNEAKGDRSFVVTQTEKPNIEFEVYLSGKLNAKITGDTYFINKQARKYSQQFTKEYKDNLKQYGYEKIEFSPSSDSQNGFNISLVANNDLSFNTPESLDYLLEFINHINVFDDDVLTKENIDFLIITSKQDKELNITLHDLDKITKIKDLTAQLEEDSYFVNKALFEKHKEDFIAIQGRLAELGYVYKNGVRMGSLTGSLLCMEDSIEDGECVGGYEVYFEGPRDAESLFKLVQFLNNCEIKFKDAFIPDGDDSVRLEDLEDIKTIDDVKERLKK